MPRFDVEMVKMEGNIKENRASTKSAEPGIRIGVGPVKVRHRQGQDKK